MPMTSTARGLSYLNDTPTTTNNCSVLKDGKRTSTTDVEDGTDAHRLERGRQTEEEDRSSTGNNLGSSTTSNTNMMKNTNIDESTTTTTTATTTASSATSGFFQTFPRIPAQYSKTSNSGLGNDVGDLALKRVLAMYLPTPMPVEVDEHLHELARTCLAPSTLRLVVDAELNLPMLSPLDTFGRVNEMDALRVGEGWRGLKDIGIRMGSVGLAHRQPSENKWNRRIQQFAANHLWAGSAALVTCPAAMTDGAAVLLTRHLHDPDDDQPGRAAVVKDARDRLVSFDPAYAWTSGQWMTERSGGSDVSGTETTAVRLDVPSLRASIQEYGSDTDQNGLPLGPWKVDGFKWFSSATDADMVVLLARTIKGISVFMAPMRRKRGAQIVMNGVRISRLKQKLGTKALPTSELEIKGMRAWLVGEEGKGTKAISPILNTTRLWTAAGAVGGWSRGLAISHAYSAVRQVRGKALLENAQHLRWMADEAVKYRAAVSLVFFGVALNGIVEQGVDAYEATKAAAFLPSDVAEAKLLLRVLTPVMKAHCSLASVAGLREVMESLGGVGYCENNEDGGILNVARLYRDCNVNPIWEGTVSVMADDFVRAVKGRGQVESSRAVDGLMQRILARARVGYEAECAHVQQLWTALSHDLRHHTRDQLLYQGRSVLSQTANVLSSALLLSDAASDGADVAGATARRWVEMILPPGQQQRQHHRSREMPVPALLHAHNVDKLIVLGAVLPDVTARAHI